MGKRKRKLTGKGKKKKNRSRQPRKQQGKKHTCAERSGSGGPE